MRKLLTILFFPLVTFCQTDTLVWETGDEKSVDKYQVQQAADTGGTWVTVATFEKGKSSYRYLFERQNVYWQVKAGAFKTRPMVMQGSLNRVTVTSAVKTSTNLNWNTKDERNVNYFLIQKSYNSWKTYTQTTKIYATGKGKYTYKYYQTVTKYKYRLIPVFKDSSLGSITNFK